MKYILTILLCTAVEKTCLPPHTFEETYPDIYTCHIDGYKKSIDKIKEIGSVEVNKHQIYTSFWCRELKTI